MNGSVADTFSALLARLDAPMFIATVADGEERAGCLVGYATQCSIDPPRFIACISDKNRTYAVSSHCQVMAVHVVPEGATGLAELFGGETGDDVDKFARCAWRPGPEGVPLLDDCPTRFVGRVLDRRPVGDHDALVLEPLLVEEGDGGAPLRFGRAAEIEPGHPA